jgi:molecular chaperone DnaK
MTRIKTRNAVAGPRGAAQIEVAFDIDANGIVNVTAKDKASGKEQAIRIQASGGLTEADIQRMVREAEAHAEEDKRRKELAEVRNQADAAIYTTEKALKEAEGRVGADVKTEIEQAISALKSAMQGEGVQRIREATNRLTQASMRLGEALNRAAAGTAGAGQGAGGADRPDVVDAEFEEVDEHNRKAS